MIEAKRGGRGEMGICMDSVGQTDEAGSCTYVRLVGKVVVALASSLLVGSRGICAGRHRQLPKFSGHLNCGGGGSLSYLEFQRLLPHTSFPCVLHTVDQGH